MSIFRRKKKFYFYYPEVGKVFIIKARDESEACWKMMHVSIKPYIYSYWEIITEEEYNNLKGKQL